MTRRGFTVLESLVSLAALAVAAVGVAQLGTWALGERVRADARSEAIEAAANVLEEARGRSFSDLTPEWAASRTLPEHLAGRMPGTTLTTTVEIEPGKSRVKRVTVSVQTAGFAASARPVVLVSLFADRTAEGK